MLPSGPFPPEKHGLQFETRLNVTQIRHPKHPDLLLPAFAFDGQIPGPTIRVRPGDTLQLRFHNDLPSLEEAFGGTSSSVTREEYVKIRETPINHYRRPSQTNLHWHGAHVTGTVPADNVFIRVQPGEFYEYTVKIPFTHSPGVGWIHPHVHGSSSLHVGGAAALAFVVEDRRSASAGDSTTDSTGAAVKSSEVQPWFPPLPQAIADAPELLLMIQPLNYGKLPLLEYAERATGLSATSPVPAEAAVFTLVNGVFDPLFSISAGEWYRLRLVHAGTGWVKTQIRFRALGCEHILLAKDGLYIRDFPREIKGAAVLTPGARADVMLRCSAGRPSSGPDGFRSSRNKVVEMMDFGAAAGRGERIGRLELVSRADADAPAGTRRESAASSPTSQLTSTDIGPRNARLVEVDPRPPKNVSSSADDPPFPPYPPSSFVWPPYLRDLRPIPAAPNCTGDLAFGRTPGDNKTIPSTVINNRLFSPDFFVHKTSYHTVTERMLWGLDKHPYHQHTYPVQLIDGFRESEWFRFGDFQDSFQHPDLAATGAGFTGGLPPKAGAVPTHVRVRYAPVPLPRAASTAAESSTALTGFDPRRAAPAGPEVAAEDEVVMVHCHRLRHEDRGMMTMELVRSAGEHCESERITAAGVVSEVGIRRGGIPVGHGGDHHGYALLAGVLAIILAFWAAWRAFCRLFRVFGASEEDLEGGSLSSAAGSSSCGRQDAVERRPSGGSGGSPTTDWVRLDERDF